MILFGFQVPFYRKHTVRLINNFYFILLGSSFLCILGCMCVVCVFVYDVCAWVCVIFDVIYIALLIVSH